MIQLLMYGGKIMKKEVNIFYNSEIKNQFLNYIKCKYESNEFFVTLFNQSFDFETKFNKDLYEFTPKEFEIMFVAYDEWNREATVSGKKSKIKKYLEWAIEQGYNCNPKIVKEIDVQSIRGQKIYNGRYYKDLDDLLDTIEKVYTANNIPRDYYIMIQVIAGLFWYGLDSHGISNLTRKSFKANNIISYKILNKGIEKTDIVEVDSDFYNLCIDCFDLDFVDLNCRKYYQRSSYLVRGLFKNEEEANKNTMVDIRTYMGNLGRKWKVLLNNLPADNPYKNRTIIRTDLKYSGKFYRAYLKETVFNTEVDVEFFDKENESNPLDTLKQYKHWREVYYGF